MVSIRRVPLIAFILVTIVSISLVSYDMYLIFGVYDVGRLIDVSISSIDVSRSNSEASLAIHFLFDNPSKFDLRLVYAAVFVDLNGQSLTPNYAPGTLVRYSNPIALPALSENVTVEVDVDNVASNKVPTTFPRYWFVKLQFILNNVPLTGMGTYTFYLSKGEAAS